MNKKILTLTVTLLAIALMITPLVGAKPGFVGRIPPNDKMLYFRIEMFEIPVPGGEREWFTPQGETMPPPFGAGSAKSYHVRGGTVNTIMLNLKVGQDGSVEDLNLATIDYDCSYDMDWNFNKWDAIIRIRETITIYTDESKIQVRGTLNILAVEYLHNVGLIPDYYGEGTFVGSGVVDGQKVKMAGAAGIDFDGDGWDGPWREGIVMGWPTP